MKSILTSLIALSLAGIASAVEFNGTLVDVNCKGKALSTHTRQCAISCAKSGYLVVTSKGDFYKLDEAGNAKALAALEASKKDKDLKVKVTGSLAEGVIQVDTLELAQ